MGFTPSKYASFMKKGILVMPYISHTIKKNSNESLTTIFCQQLFIYIFYLIEIIDAMIAQSWMVTDSHKQELTFLVQKCTEHQVTSTSK